MKNFILLFLVCHFSYSFAQENSLDYYPLDIGNQWRYQSICVEFIDGKLDTIIHDTLLTKVVGDTIMPNGRQYYHVAGLDGGFRRIDTLAAKVYEYNNQYAAPDSVDEYLLWDFTIRDTTDWRDGLGNHITVHSSTSPVRVGGFDQYAPQKSFLGAYLYSFRVFSLGIGESFFSYGCIHPNSENSLISAKVKGICYSQTKDSLLNYYPLQIGNRWEFKIEPYLSHPSMDKYDKLSIEILGDSTLPNGKKYSVFQQKYTPEFQNPVIYFDRIDSSTFNIYRYNNHYANPDYYGDELLIDSLKANVGDHINRNYLCRITNMPGGCEYYQFSQDSVLGHWAGIKKFVSGGLLEVDNFYWLVDGIGLANITTVDINRYDTLYVWHLTFAKIGTKEYGLKTGIKRSGNQNLHSFKLYQNHPNPFNSSTEIKYELFDRTPVEINVYNKIGQRLITKYCGVQKAGIYKKILSFQNMSSGLYFIELRTNGNKEMRKCILIK